MINTNYNLYNFNVYKFQKNQHKNNINFTGNLDNPLELSYFDADCLYEQTNNGYVKVINSTKPIKVEGVNDLWDKLSKENEAKQYFKINFEETYQTSFKAKELLEVLDNLPKQSQREFVDLFCRKTGFPNLKKVSENAEAEITRAIYKLAKENNFNVKFMGYDSNSSLGRKYPLPGKDADGLFIIIEPPKDSPDYFCGLIRWKLKDVINQRMVSTPSNHLPEVLSTNYIEQGLDLAQELFDEANFTNDDLSRFKENLKDSSKDFIKSAEFDITLAKRLPKEKQIRDNFYKTAMFVELVRDGKVMENNFSAEFIEKIKNSPLYKYSNIMKEQGFRDIEKQKHILRQKLEQEFENYDDEKQFEIVKDMIHSSLGVKDAKNEKLFTNESKDGSNEMGNIVEMYNMLLNA